MSSEIIDNFYFIGLKLYLHKLYRMAFRYEIWKMKDTALPDGDVFNINNYEYFKSTAPNDSKFSLSVAKYKDEVFYRVSSGGTLLFTGDGYTDITDITSDCVSYILLIFDQSTKKRSSYIETLFFDKADWIGFIRKRSAVFDYDRCSVTLEPDVFDVYTKLLRGYEDKKNVYDLVDREYVKGIYFPNNVETFVRERTSTTEPIPTSNTPIINCDDDIDFNKGVRINLKYTKSEADTVYNITETYIREYKYINKNEIYSNFYFGECVLANEGGWSVDGFDVGWWGLPESVKLIRRLLNLSVGDLSYTKVGDAFYLDIDPDLMWGKRRGIKVSKLLSAFRDDIEGVDTISSDILNNTQNPLTLAGNEYTNLIMMQQSDVATNSDGATKFEMSLKDLFDILSIMNLKWFINNGGKLKVEHIKYFENFGTYTNNIVPYMYKLPVNAARKVVKYKDDMPPNKETFKQPFALYKDFVGYDITYPQGCAGDETIDHDFNVTTDVYGLLVSDPVNMQAAGAVLLHTDKSTTTYFVNGVPVIIDIYNVKTYPTPNSPIQFPAMNGALSLSILHDVFWKNGRYVITGKMNDTETTFDSVFPQLIRNGVPIKRTYKEINPIRKIDTELGDASILEGEFDIKNCIWNTTIEYRETNG